MCSSDLSLQLKDGRVLKKHVAHARGSVANPMTDTDLEDKFRAQCKGVLTTAQAGKLLQLCWNIGQLKRVSDIARASVPK